MRAEVAARVQPTLLRGLIPTGVLTGRGVSSGWRSSRQWEFRGLSSAFVTFPSNAATFLFGCGGLPDLLECAERAHRRSFVRARLPLQRRLLHLA